MSRVVAKRPAERHLRLSTSEPERLWVRRYFVNWPGPELPWLDVARGRLGAGGGVAGVPRGETLAPGPGPVYVPPVPAELEKERDALVDRLAGDGVAVVAQWLLGSGSVPAKGEGVELVLDPLAALLAEGEQALACLPSAADVMLWPLVPGLTDATELWQEACARISAAGLRCVHPLVPQLEPRDRQRLLETCAERDTAFERLFHAAPPRRRDFARVASSYGLATIFRRPPMPPGREARNLAAAERLALAGDLWLRLGRSEARAQELFRASRAAEEVGIDLRAAVCEGNLDVIPWLRGPAARILREWAEGKSDLLDAWISRWEAPERPAEEER